MTYKARSGWKKPAQNPPAPASLSERIERAKEALQTAKNLQKLAPASEQESARRAVRKAARKLLRTKISGFDALMRKMAIQSPTWEEFSEQISTIYPEVSDLLDEPTCRALGIDCSLRSDGRVFLNTRARELGAQRFCVVDIEANDSSAGGQMLEIGAVMIENGLKIGEFSRLIYSPMVSEKITELTGISAPMLRAAPRLASVLSEFRLFLGDAIFVAHGVEFDYCAVAKGCLESLCSPLLNRRLCTLKLSRKFIDSPSHNLHALREKFGICSREHRALDDAQAAAVVLAKCLQASKAAHASVEDLLAL